MRFVTSFSGAGYALYGKAFLISWAEYVGLPLIAYVEEDTPEHSGVEYRDLWEVPECKAFVRDAQATNDFRFDARKFARKAFAELDALEKESGVVCWIDADVEFSDRLTEEGCKKTLGEYITYLGRGDYHPCTSFVAWNTAHPDHAKFLERWGAMWRDRDVYGLREWHDAYVFNHCTSDLTRRNLCDGMVLSKPHENVFDRVFPMAHHKKGNTK